MAASGIDRIAAPARPGSTARPRPRRRTACPASPLPLQRARLSAPDLRRAILPVDHRRLGPTHGAARRSPWRSRPVTWRSAGGRVGKAPDVADRRGHAPANPPPRRCQQAAAVEAGVPALATARDLVDQVHRMVRARTPAVLQDWITCAVASLVAACGRGIAADGAAVPRSADRALVQRPDRGSHHPADADPPADGRPRQARSAAGQARRASTISSPARNNRRSPCSMLIRNQPRPPAARQGAGCPGGMPGTAFRGRPDRPRKDR
jgi:hypothetical protein